MIKIRINIIMLMTLSTLSLQAAEPLYKRQASTRHASYPPQPERTHYNEAIHPYNLPATVSCPDFLTLGSYPLNLASGISFKDPQGYGLRVITFSDMLQKSGVAIAFVWAKYCAPLTGYLGRLRHSDLENPEVNLYVLENSTSKICAKHLHNPSVLCLLSKHYEAINRHYLSEPLERFKAIQDLTKIMARYTFDAEQISRHFTKYVPEYKVVGATATVSSSSITTEKSLPSSHSFAPSQSAKSAKKSGQAKHKKNNQRVVIQTKTSIQNIVNNAANFTRNSVAQEFFDKTKALLSPLASISNELKEAPNTTSDSQNFSLQKSETNHAADLPQPLSANHVQDEQTKTGSSTISTAIVKIINKRSLKPTKLATQLTTKPHSEKAPHSDETHEPIIVLDARSHSEKSPDVLSVAHDTINTISEVENLEEGRARLTAFLKILDVPSEPVEEVIHQLTQPALSEISVTLEAIGDNSEVATENIFSSLTPFFTEDNSVQSNILPADSSNDRIGDSSLVATPSFVTDANDDINLETTLESIPVEKVNNSIAEAACASIDTVSEQSENDDFFDTFGTHSYSRLGVLDDTPLEDTPPVVSTTKKPKRKKYTIVIHTDKGTKVFTASSKKTVRSAEITVEKSNPTDNQSIFPSNWVDEFDYMHNPLK